MNEAASRVLIVSRNFPPLRGGMERLIYHAAQELVKTYEVHVVGPTGAEAYVSPGVRTYMASPMPVSSFLLHSTWLATAIARQVKPTAILAGSGLNALPAVIAGRMTGRPVITYLHGLDLIAEHALYKRIFLPCIRACTAWIANSRATQQLALQAGLPAARISVLHPGTTLPKRPSEDRIQGWRRRIGAGARPVLLSVGRLTPRKGLAPFVEKALPKIVAAQPDALLVVVGEDAHAAVGRNKRNYSNEIRQAIERTGLISNVLLLGAIDDDELSDAYFGSNVHILPTLDLRGDMEGFGMVAIEAAAHGLVTVAFNAGGVRDAISDGISGVLVPPADYDSLAQTVINVLQGTVGVDRDACRRFAGGFEWTAFGTRLGEIITMFSTASE